MPKGPPSLEDITTQYALRKQFWAPRDRRMDFWHLTYLLFDAHQQGKAPGRQRFVSNEPANIVDKGAAAIAKNRIRLSCPIDNVYDPGERDEIARYEDLGYGIIDEIDESLVNRGASGNLREIFAKQALLRGWISFCEMMQPGDDRGMVWFDDWDPRFTYPDFDRWGMRSTLNYSEDLLGNVLGDHPWLEQDFSWQDDMQQTVRKYIWYDREYYGCVGEVAQKTRRSERTKLVWLSQDPDTQEPGPFRHELPDIPATMIPVNGLNFKYAPQYANLVQETSVIQQDMRWMDRALDRYRFGQNHWVADRGRSIFANAEKSFPQFNELVATLWQVVANEAYGTWVLKTRDGRMVELKLGDNSVNPLRLDESLDKLNPHVAPPNITDLLSIGSRENERATFSFKLFGDEFQGSGFLFNQVQEGMANALHPFSTGVERAMERVARIGTRQFRLGGFSGVNLFGRRPQSRRIFHMQVSSQDFEKDYPIFAELTLAVPDDMLAKINMARILADPRRPLASLQTIFDKILGWDDPDGEKEKIFEDVADTDPIIVLERTARALEKRGLPELATSIRDKEFMMKAVQEMQKNQMMGNGNGLQPPAPGAPAQAGGSGGPAPNPTATTGGAGTGTEAVGAAGGPF